MMACLHGERALGGSYAGEPGGGVNMADAVQGTELIAALPQQASAAREEALFDAVAAGHIAPITWAEVQSGHGKHRATFFVTADALRVGCEEDSIRINASARTTQRIADLLGCVLQTAHLCDLVWEQATVKIAPCISAPDAAMATTARMLRHHQAVEARVAGRTGLIENVGKHWVLSNRLVGSRDRAANYGWYDAAAAHRSGRYALWQPVGLAHDLNHVDYSQVVRLVQRRCVVDDVERDIAEVMADPALSGLVSNEGPLRVLRQPGVPAA
jgi:hypothetical protein